MILIHDEAAVGVGAGERLWRSSSSSVDVGRPRATLRGRGRGELCRGGVVVVVVVTDEVAFVVVVGGARLDLGMFDS